MSEEKFCKNCGKQISDDFKLCPYCGEKVEEEILEIPCQFCRKTIKSDFKVCPYCGNNNNSKKENHNNYNNYNTENKENNYSNSNEVSHKSGIACLLLWFFFGGAGGHRFYAGQVASAFGLLALNFLGFFLLFSANELGIIILVVSGLWLLIDFILIVSGSFKDSKGKCIKIKN